MSQATDAGDHSTENNELDQFERKFGPFDPPADYQFEPEFSSPPPRPIPRELYNGRYFRKLRMRLVALFVTGIVLLIGSFIPIVRLWSLYVLPLKYLHWIAAAVLVVYGVAWIRYLFSRGPLIYVQEGIPIVARITALFLRTKLVVNGVPSIFEYVAVLQHRDLRTDGVIFSSTTYEVGTSKDQLALTYRLGDYVTAVYLQSNPEKSLRLYGFLGLRPNLGITARAKPRELTMLQLVGTIIAIGGIVFGLAWNVYAFGRYSPLALSLREHGLPFVLGAVTFGGGLIGLLVWWDRRKRRQLETDNREAAATGGPIEVPWKPPKLGLMGQGPIMSVLLLFGCLVMGGGTMLCWASTLNAMCDSSPAALRPIRVREMWMKTHTFLFREYTIEYEFADDPQKQKHEMLTTPWHILSFGPVRTGIAHIRGGFLGWPWVETLTPDVPKQLPGP